MAVALTYALENNCLPGSTIEKAENLFLTSVSNYVSTSIIKDLNKGWEKTHNSQRYTSHCIPIGNYNNGYWNFDGPLDNLFQEKLQKLSRQKILAEFSDLCKNNLEITPQAVISLFSSDPFVRLCFDVEWLNKIREKVFTNIAGI